MAISRREAEAREALNKIRAEESAGIFADAGMAGYNASRERMEREMGSCEPSQSPLNKLNKLAEGSFDPWQHRAAGMRCKTCMWFVVKPFNGLRSEDARGNLGRCRRHAPTMAGYPATFTSDWCGDHKLDETKL